MAKKKIKVSKEVVPINLETPEKDMRKVIQPLSVDYPNEGLNDMARKINEIIEEING